MPSRGHPRTMIAILRGRKFFVKRGRLARSVQASRARRLRRTSRRRLSAFTAASRSGSCTRARRTPVHRPLRGGASTARRTTRISLCSPAVTFMFGQVRPTVMAASASASFLPSASARVAWLRTPSRSSLSRATTQTSSMRFSRSPRIEKNSRAPPIAHLGNVEQAEALAAREERKNVERN